MGQSQTLYCLHNMQTLEYSDLQAVKYLWVDKNITNNQNQSNLNIFRQHFNVLGFSDLPTLKSYVESSETQGKERMRAICSASLDDEVYRYIQSKQSIDRAMLFCGNKTKASILMRDFSKIKLACFICSEVIATAKKWVKQQIQSVYFFNPQEMHKLNLAVANWRAFTDISIAYNPQSFTDFVKMAKKLFRFQDPDNKIKQFIQGVDKAQKNPAFPFWLMDYAIDNDYFLKQVNTMLRSTKDPTKLAYVRWPVHKLFNNIKKHYLINSQILNKNYYGVLQLSQLQKTRLKRNEYICINQFILATTKDLHQKGDKNVLYIKISVTTKGNVCNGFYSKQQAAVFNLGNFYKIQSLNNNLLAVELVTLTDKIQIKEGDLISGIFLCHAKAQKMHITKQGQWYSLFLNGKQQQANEYIQRVNELKKKRNEVDDIIRWNVIREKVKCQHGRSSALSLKKLEEMLAQAQYEQKVTIYLAIAEIYIMNKEFIKFSKTLAEMQTCMLKQQSRPSLNKEITSQINLLKNCNQFLNPQITEQRIEELIQYFSYFEEELINKDKANYLNKAYLLCLFISACCLEKVEKYNQQIYVLNRILELLIWTEGRQSYEYKLISSYKRKAFQAMNRQESEMQLQRKKKLRTNQNLIDKLLEKDIPLKIDISSLNMSLYD